MSAIHRTSSLSDINNTVVTSPEILDTPTSKKRKTMETSNGVVMEQTTLDFGQRTPNAPNPKNSTVTIKSKEYKSLISKMDEISSKLQHVVKVSDLGNIMKNLATKEEVEQCVNSAASKLSDENEQLRADLHTMKCENDILKTKVTQLESQVDNQQTNLNSAHYKADCARDQLNDLEQHGRANSIRMYGVPGAPNETAAETVSLAVNVINSKLGLHLGIRDIDVAHRLPHIDRTNTNPKSMIIKFLRRMDKFMVIENRSKLRGSGIVIKEDLTSQNSGLLNAVSQRSDVKKSWVVAGGKVYAEMKGRNKVVKPIVSDLKRRLRTYENSQMEAGVQKPPIARKFTSGSANKHSPSKQRIPSNSEQQLIDTATDNDMEVQGPVSTDSDSDVAPNEV